MIEVSSGVLLVSCNDVLCVKVNVSELGLVTQSGKVVWGTCSCALSSSSQG